MKVKEIWKSLMELYAEKVFKFIDFDELIWKLIEDRGIVVIDEIDKLVR